MLRIAVTIAFVFLLAFFYERIIMPFVLAAMCAALFEPAIHIISAKTGLRRSVVSTGLFLIIIIKLVIGAIIVVPTLYEQIVSLTRKFPYYKTYFDENLVPKITGHIKTLSPDAASNLKTGLNQLGHYIFSDMQTFATNVWQYTMSTISAIVLIFLFPVALFYFMRDFNLISESFEKSIPNEYQGRVMKILKDSSKVLRSYVRGQFYVSFVLTLYYFIGLSIIGVDFALLLGILSAILIIIPLIGFIAAFCISAMVCYFDFGTGNQMLYVCLLYVFGYALESWILTPKIIGDEIGLHPLWILFSVLILGSILGFWGLLFAIPIAGIIKVLLKSLLEYEKV